MAEGVAEGKRLSEAVTEVEGEGRLLELEVGLRAGVLLALLQALPLTSGVGLALCVMRALVGLTLTRGGTVVLASADALPAPPPEKVAGCVGMEDGAAVEECWVLADGERVGDLEGAGLPLALGLSVELGVSEAQPLTLGEAVEVSVPPPALREAPPPGDTLPPLQSDAELEREALRVTLGERVMLAQEEGEGLVLALRVALEHLEALGVAEGERGEVGEREGEREAEGERVGLSDAEGLRVPPVLLLGCRVTEPLPLEQPDMLASELGFGLREGLRLRLGLGDGVGEAGALLLIAALWLPRALKEADWVALGLSVPEGEAEGLGVGRIVAGKVTVPVPVLVRQAVGVRETVGEALRLRVSVPVAERLRVAMGVTLQAPKTVVSVTGVAAANTSSPVCVTSTAHAPPAAVEFR